MDSETKAEFDRYHLSPSNSSLVRLPAEEQLPTLPDTIEDDANTPRRRSINPELDR
jgi:hypothetical protein